MKLFYLKCIARNLSNFITGFDLFLYLDLAPLFHDRNMYCKKTKRYQIQLFSSLFIKTQILHLTPFLLNGISTDLLHLFVN